MGTIWIYENRVAEKTRNKRYVNHSIVVDSGFPACFRGIKTSAHRRHVMNLHLFRGDAELQPTNSLAVSESALLAEAQLPKQY